MGYAEAVTHLDALGIDAMKRLKPSTERIEALSELLDHPERQVPAIHITGTNGKTSVARIASSLLTSAGLSVATYTSPHLEDVRERLDLSGEPISQDAFGEVFDHIQPYIAKVEADLGERITYFETLTAMFFLWAAETPVDAVVVEVGLGGRWDATNVLPASVPVITQVGLDHMALLGSDRPTIAREKAGIVKANSVVVTGERSPDVLAVITQESAARDSEVVVLGRDFELTENRVAFGGRYLSLRTSRANYDGMFLPLHGAHQGVNAMLALEAVTRFIPARQLESEVLLEGFAAAYVPGRIETVRTDARLPVVLDVAHNPDGMSALITSLTEAFAFDRVVFVVGILEDKDHLGMLTEMQRVPASLVVTEPAFARARSSDDLMDAASSFGIEARVVPTVAAAVASALEDPRDGDLVCITGSHYVVGEARTLLLASESSTAKGS